MLNKQPALPFDLQDPALDAGEGREPRVGPDEWLIMIRGALEERLPRVLDLAQEAVEAFPNNPELLLNGALAALASAKVGPARHC